MTYTERFDRALLLASEVHRHQKRKGTEIPYITHVLAVAALVGNHGGDEDQVIGGLLHDAIEDGIKDFPDIRERIRGSFGERVLAIVEACTDADTDPKPPWKERKLAYLAHLRTDPDTGHLLVSLSDKVHNAGAIVMDLSVVGDELWQRFNVPKEETLWYYGNLVEIFEERVPSVLTKELARLVRLMS